MSPRFRLFLYLAAVVAISFIHVPWVLAFGLVLALAFTGPMRWKLLRRALFAILAFNLTVSLGYAALALWQGNFAWDTLLLANLRVLFLVYLGFWYVARGDGLRALAAWPLARLILTLAIGQIKVFERILRDFRLAFDSRNLARPRSLDRAHLAAAQSRTLLDKSVASAGEAALAMRSRGAFDD